MTDFDDQELAWLRWASREGAEPTGGDVQAKHAHIGDPKGQQACPDAEQVRAAAWAELPKNELAVVLDHVSQCSSCAGLWRLALELRPEQGEGALGQASGAYRSALPVRLALMAAALVLAVGLWWVLQPPSELGTNPDHGVMRDLGSTSTIQLLSPPQLPRSDFNLRWEGPERSRWMLRLSTASGQLLVEALDLDQPTYLVTEDLLGTVPAGEELILYLEAEAASDRHLVRASFPIRLTGD